MSRLADRFVWRPEEVEGGPEDWKPGFMTVLDTQTGRVYTADEAGGTGDIIGELEAMAADGEL